MSQTRAIRKDDDDSPLAKMAQMLIRRLGVEGAVRVCRENSWHGVLQVIEDRRNDAIHI